ncbi:hypothetical protein KZ829_19065 [Actinoplanes hulinensis]|uniref:Uncharacterized protein n=1 Tax=Actinoplanes hulinensis TaxID=1144547 RepID=A0ABS7B4F4_9ACTN|nr:hypothetical protein [Actinoplanes hulinensis]MBW6435845.1 hypothetical protein [Actinoplanes hulinensis]
MTASPEPEPIAALLLEYLSQRTDMRTATNREACWLFPARLAAESGTTWSSYAPGDHGK